MANHHGIRAVMVLLKQHRGLHRSEGAREWPDPDLRLALGIHIILQSSAE
jgi:hypothetical protein